MHTVNGAKGLRDGCILLHQISKIRNLVTNVYG